MQNLHLNRASINLSLFFFPLLDQIILSLCTDMTSCGLAAGLHLLLQHTSVAQEDLSFCNNFLLCYSGLWFLDFS